MSTVSFSSVKDNMDFPNVQDVDPKEVFENRESLNLIDVREPDEFTGELGHAPGAKLIPLGELESRFNEIPRDKTVVFICRSGGRSGRATAFAKGNGLNSSFNMAGGMLRWNEESIETEK